MAQKIKDFKAEFDFKIKSLMRFSPPIFKKRVKSIEDFDKTLSSKKRKRLSELDAKYDIENWQDVCSYSEFLGNLCLLDIFDQNIPIVKKDLASLDIGSRNWWYFPALYSFKPGPWKGVEIDAYQRYLDFSTRKAQAEYQIKPFKGSEYIAGDLLDIKGEFGLITWLLPYVEIGPLKISGLPQKFFNPDILFEHAISLLTDGGTLHIVNQGREEMEIQKSLFKRFNLDAKFLDAIDSPFSPYKKQRYGWLYIKK